MNIATFMLICKIEKCTAFDGTLQLTVWQHVICTPLLDFVTQLSVQRYALNVSPDELPTHIAQYLNYENFKLYWVKEKYGEIHFLISTWFFGDTHACCAISWVVA